MHNPTYFLELLKKSHADKYRSHLARKDITVWCHGHPEWSAVGIMDLVNMPFAGSSINLILSDNSAFHPVIYAVACDGTQPVKAFLMLSSGHSEITGMKQLVHISRDLDSVVSLISRNAECRITTPRGGHLVYDYRYP